MVKTVAMLCLLCAQERDKSLDGARDESVQSVLEKAELAEQARRHVTARIEGETSTGEHGDTLVLAGMMALRVGECGDRTIVVEVNEKGRKTGAVRTRVDDSEAIVQAAGCKFAVVFDLARKKNFNPFDLWRTGLRKGLTEEFDIKLLRSPAEAVPPAAVTDPDGRPVEPRPAKGVARKKGVCVAAEGVDPAERAYVLRLAPKDEELRKRLRTIELHVNPEFWRIERMRVEGGGRVTVYVLTEFESPENVEDGFFEFDLSDMMVERR